MIDILIDSFVFYIPAMIIGGGLILAQLSEWQREELHQKFMANIKNSSENSYFN